MPAATDVLYIDNTNNVWIEGLKNAVSGAFINNATCEIVELLDAAGAAVAGVADIAMTYKASSDGDYYGPIPHTVSLTEDAEYTVHATATTTIEGETTVADWRRKVRARYRNS